MLSSANFLQVNSVDKKINIRMSDTTTQRSSFTWGAAYWNYIVLSARAVETCKGEYIKDDQPQCRDSKCKRTLLKILWSIRPRRPRNRDATANQPNNKPLKMADVHKSIKNIFKTIFISNIRHFSWLFIFQRHLVKSKELSNRFYMNLNLRRWLMDYCIVITYRLT